MSQDPESGLETLWLSAETPLRLASARFEDLRLRGRELILRGWLGDEVALGTSTLLGQGPERALVARAGSKLSEVLIVGEEGSELLRLDLDTAEWRHVAELPRFPNEVGGMCFLAPIALGSITLLHWELGILALGPSLELLWRHDLEWNHAVVSVSDDEVWFDLMYESEEIGHQIGDSPYGFRVADGQQLFDRKAPNE